MFERLRESAFAPPPREALPVVDLSGTLRFTCQRCVTKLAGYKRCRRPQERNAFIFKIAFSIGKTPNLSLTIQLKASEQRRSRSYGTNQDLGDLIAMSCFCYMTTGKSFEHRSSKTLEVFKEG